MEKYSRSQVTKAGKKLVEYEGNNSNPEIKMLEAFKILSFWRSEHITPLDFVFEKLQKTVKKIDKNAIYAKRLKRLESIKKKLIRYEDMGLGNMQDIGGCRVVVSSLKKTNKVLKELKKWPEFKKDDGTLRIKDYIENPKNDGYRSIHLIGKFSNGKFINKNIEIQIRTLIQHDWATALEIVDIFTKQNLKSNLGEKDWANFFSNVSKEFQAMENIHLFSHSDRRSINEYFNEIKNNTNRFNNHVETKKIISKLNVLDRFNAFRESINLANEKISEKKFDGYILLQINIKKELISASFFSKEQSGLAEKTYTEREIEHTGSKEVIIALISTNSIGNIKEAYPNYFADSRDFIKYLFVIKESPFSKGFFS